MNFRSQLSARELIAWVLVLLSLAALWSRPLQSEKLFISGGSCLCNKEEYCLCSPNLAIDIIIETTENSIVLVKRRDSGKYATIGGFVEVGEDTETAVKRELKEETGLEILEGSCRLLGIYSDPRRDHRRHTTSAVYVARTVDLSSLKAGDDAKGVEIVDYARLLDLDYDFDHRVIISDYLSTINQFGKKGGEPFLGDW
eukprot:CAMPEP_0172598838 /NCGR_PEP_ID=MMETSP1068-20121228/18906_1 /TAXON_ID=35684 /ORGANISM="Pseudopedinella elastica, Strain CCMP716" /LENGTH=198 /DNA_ID=CAMNT_0013398867 /DNA_START=203 /DNA_END=796 /DNA_ORIENTATION=-